MLRRSFLKITLGTMLGIAAVCPTLKEPEVKYWKSSVAKSMGPLTVDMLNKHLANINWAHTAPEWVPIPK